jgi:tetratricopeptide (TPR) repeat protein
LQSKFKDKGVTCIGVTSVDENGNTLEAVEALVKKREDKIGYSIAWDKQRTTNEAYMDAARQGGIPCAFLIDQEGLLAWVGHPMELDEPLEKVVEKKWDLKKAAAEFKEELDANKAMEEVTEEFEKFQEAMGKEDFAAALKIMDEVAEKKPVLAPRLAMGRFFVLLESKQYDKAYAAAEQAADKYYSKKAPELEHMARTILELEGVEKPNAELAVKLASRAAEVAPDHAGALDTLAMAYDKKGDFAKAAETLKKSISMAEKHKAPDEILKELKDRLAEYESKAKGEKKDGEKK